jgi:hypothetical protein
MFLCMYFWQMLLVNPTVFTVAVRTAPLWTNEQRYIGSYSYICEIATATTWIGAAKLATLAMAKAQVMKRTEAAKGVATRNALNCAKPLKNCLRLTVLFACTCLQCCGSGIRCLLTLDPGWKIKIRSGMNILDHISESFLG